MANLTPTNRVRVAGSGFTIFTFGGNPIAFCQQVNYQSPQFVGNGMSAIQPMDEPYPVEIITPIAAGPGQLTLNLIELFGQGGNVSKVWDRLGSPAGSSANLANPFGGTSGDQFQDDVSTQLASVTNSSNPFYGAVDIVDIAIRQALLSPAQMQIVKIIRPLQAYGFNTPKPYTEEYVGCVITNVTDNENVEVGTLEVIKQITVTYRYVTRNGRASQAFSLRDTSLAS